MPATTLSSVTLRSTVPALARSEILVIGVLSTDSGVVVAPGNESVTAAFGVRLAGSMAALGVAGTLGEVTRIPTGDVIGAPVLVTVGLGPVLSPDSLVVAAGAAARSVTNATTAAVSLGAGSADEVGAVTTGLLLGGYRFDRYRSGPTPSNRVQFAVLTANASDPEVGAALTRAEIVAEAVALTRDWVNTPPVDFTPEVFAQAVVDAVDRIDTIESQVYDEHQLRALGCGGILAVGAGSAAAPRLVELDYCPAEAVAHMALVGKGVTFDSGGLNIKHGAQMATAKDDMAGAAAIATAVVAIAQLGLPIRVTAQLPMVENMISGSAMRPGDVVTIHGGTTVEINDTDCEGRLILADALARAVEAEPDVILDVATLSGSIVHALGDRITGLFGSESVTAGIQRAAERAGEPVWLMPIPEVMVERIKSSPIADLVNYDMVRWGGASLAAAFLREFADDVAWGHLDIGGTSFNAGAPRGHVTSGGTGVAVATLVAYAEDLVAERG